MIASAVGTTQPGNAESLLNSSPSWAIL